MTTQPKNHQTPTQKIQTWIRDFVTRPNPIFGDLPPCPFAQKAMVDGKVEFVEMPTTSDYTTMYQMVQEFDFDAKDVLVMILPGDHCSARVTHRVAVTQRCGRMAQSRCPVCAIRRVCMLACLPVFHECEYVLYSGIRALM